MPATTRKTINTVAFDGRYINDRYHGIGRYAFHLVDELASLKPGIAFRVLRDPSLAESRFNWEQLSAHPNVQLVDVAAAPFSAAEQWAVPRALLESGPVFYHTPYFALPWLLRAPSAVTVHDCIFERNAAYMPKRWARGYYRLAMLVSLQRARAVFVPSRATAHDVLKFYHVRRSKIVVTPEAADSVFRPMSGSALDEVRRKYSLPDKFVLAVGARRPHKNFPILVRAMSRIDGSGGELVFVGDADERFPDETRRIVEALDAPVRFLGKVPEADLPSLYNLCSLVACPSLIEGFGLPVLEAMSCGTPVVCSDIEVFREVAGSAALYADPADPAPWAAAITSILGDAARARAFSERSLIRASLFSWRRTAEAAAPVYARLLASR